MKRAGLAIGLGLMGLAAFLIPSPASPASQDSSLGHNVFVANCSFCHTVPDASLKGDRLWIDRIKTTV